MTTTVSEPIDFTYTAHIKAADLYLLMVSTEVIRDLETDEGRKANLDQVIQAARRALEEAGIRFV